MPRFNKRKNRNVQEWKQDAVNIKARGVPRAMVVKLPYFEELKNMVINSQDKLVQIWRLNSMFDPYETGTTGIVPYGFPEMSLLYREYMVLTASVVLELQSVDVAYGTILMYFTDDHSVIPDSEDLINNVGVQYKTFNSPLAGNTNIVKLKRKFHLPDWHGRELDPYRDSAAVNANPPQGAYLVTKVENHNNVQTKITYRIKILFTARLFNVHEPSNSLGG